VALLYGCALASACAQTPDRPPASTPTPAESRARPATVAEPELSDAERLRQAQRHSSHRLVVASFSILSAQAGIERVASAVAELDADVIGLQAVEVGTSRADGLDVPAELAARLGYHAAFGEAAKLTAGARGVALLSRAPLRRVETLLLPANDGEPGSLLMARTEINGKRWTVGVAAMSPPADPPSADLLRRRQGRLIAEALGGRDACVLLIDLQGPAELSAWAPLTTVGNFVGLEAGPTYPARDPTLRRDHVLLSPELWASTTQVVDTGVSDHRAVVVQVATRR